MNKWQLIILGVMVVALCVILFTVPEYVIWPDSGPDLGRRVYSDHPTFETIKTNYGSYIEWNTFIIRSIPVLLIGVLLVLILGKTGKHIDKFMKKGERRQNRKEIIDKWYQLLSNECKQEISKSTFGFIYGTTPLDKLEQWFEVYQNNPNPKAWEQSLITGVKNKRPTRMLLNWVLLLILVCLWFIFGPIVIYAGYSPSMYLSGNETMKRFYLWVLFGLGMLLTGYIGARAMALLGIDKRESDGIKTWRTTLIIANLITFLILLAIILF